MNLPFRRRSRPRGRARLALTGDFPATDHDMTEALQRADYDGDTYWGGASDIGVMAIATFSTAPLDGYQPAPASFPVLQAAPEPEPRPVLPPVPVTERAVIGDELRLPIIWCEMPSCISWHRDPASAGERDARVRAHDAGWRTDALGRLACPDCQQARADYRTPQPVTWHHREVSRRWYERGSLPTEETQDRLAAEAEYARIVSYKNPSLARAMIDATHRTAAS